MKSSPIAGSAYMFMCDNAGTSIWPMTYITSTLEGIVVAVVVVEVLFISSADASRLMWTWTRSREIREEDVAMPIKGLRGRLSS
jgi:hypothetical protein